MVACEYCKKQVPKGEKRVRYFFIIIEEDEPIHPDGLDAHVDQHHHHLLVCKNCEKNIFKSMDDGMYSTHPSRKSPSRKSPSRKSPSRKSPSRKSPSRK